LDSGAERGARPALGRSLAASSSWKRRHVFHSTNLGGAAPHRLKFEPPEQAEGIHLPVTGESVAMANLSPGDKVTWKSSRGETSGVVKKKLTRKTTVKSHVVAASKKNPEYLVESSKTGARAAHKPSALKKK
jgi:hypothetical protein